MSHTIYLALYFVSWYTTNATYNIYNQEVKKEFNFAFATSALQLLVGLAYVAPLWLVNARKRPTLSLYDVVAILPIVLLNSLGHIASVVAMFEKGGGSLTHVIKASEPVVSVILAYLIDGKIPGIFTFISLLVITFGVAFASTNGNIQLDVLKVELSSKIAILAMVANIAFALRSIFRKKIINKQFKDKTCLDPLNDHAVITILSLIITLAICPLFEDVSVYYKSFSDSSDQLIWNVFVCGISWYLYNEFQNIVLDSLGPIPTAVGNALKRVAVFVAFHYFVPGEEIADMKAMGCAIAVCGCFLYALCDYWHI